MASKHWFDEEGNHTSAYGRGSCLTPLFSGERFVTLLGLRFSFVRPSSSTGGCGFHVAVSRPHHWIVGYRRNPKGLLFESKPQGFYFERPRGVRASLCRWLSAQYKEHIRG